MAARVVEIADALVALINGGSYSISVSATRRWLWYQGVTEIGITDPVVSVIPRDVRTARRAAARRLNNRQYGLVLAIQKKLPEQSERSEIDALILLQQEIIERVEPTDASAAASPSGAGYVDTEHEDGLLYDPEDLQLRLFTSLTTFIFDDER